MHRKLLLIVTALALAACSKEPLLPNLFPVPAATLTADNGQPVRLTTMKGKVVVYDFIYTTCGSTCPIMTEQMRQLTTKIDKDAPVRFISITVDPAHDTPAKLHEYASHVRTDNRWLFLTTGDPVSLVKLSVDGFRLAAAPPAPGSEPVLHSSKFAIADKNGIIREYYGSTDGDAVDHVAKTVKQLLRED